MNIEEYMVKKHNKPGFFDWVLHSPKAYLVLSMMSIFVGFAISALMLLASFMFDYHIIFKVLFSLMFLYQIWFVIQAWGKRKTINNTVYDFTYKGQFKNKEVIEAKVKDGSAKE